MRIQSCKTLKLNFTYVNCEDTFFFNAIRLILFTRPNRHILFPSLAGNFSLSISRDHFQNLSVVLDEKSPNQELRLAG